MPDVLHVKSLPPHAASTGTMLMLERSSENIPTSYILLVLDALSKNITPTFLVDLPPCKDVVLHHPRQVQLQLYRGVLTHLHRNCHHRSFSVLCLRQSIHHHGKAPKSTLPLLALQGSPSFFQKKNIQKHQKSRSHVTRVRIVRLRTNDCPSEPPARKEGIFLCLERFTVEAETLQTHAQRHTPRSNSIVGAMPLSCGFSSVQEHSLLWTSQAPARTGPSHPTTSRPARVLPRQLRDKCVPSSGEQPLLKLISRRCTSFGCAIPSQGQTRVVSIANYAPPKRDNPSATTSRRRVSLTLNQVTSKSQTVTFVETRPPASLLPCAAAHSNASLRLPKHANLRARSSMMAKDVEETTTSASATGQGDGKTSAATEQETKRLRVDPTHTAGREGL